MNWYDDQRHDPNGQLETEADHHHDPDPTADPECRRDDLARRWPLFDAWVPSLAHSPPARCRVARRDNPHRSDTDEGVVGDQSDPEVHADEDRDGCGGLVPD